MNRRTFLKRILYLVGGYFAHLSFPWVKTECPTGGGRARAQPAASRPQVLRIYHPNATDWNFQNSPQILGTHYWDHVDLAACRAMVNDGLKLFSQKASRSEAWDWVFRQNGGAGYQTGQKIAIKLNWNDCDPALDDPAYPGGNSNWLVSNTQLVQAVIESLLANVPGLTAGDILVGDPSRTPYNRIRNPLASLGVTVIEFNQGIFTASPGALVDYPAWQDDYVCAAMFDQAAHLIDMPLLKAIGTNWGISGVLKDAQGKVAIASASYSDTRGAWIYKHDNTFSNTGSNFNFNTLVQMNAHPWIRDKRRLIIGDGLYGLFNGQHFEQPANLKDDRPRPWLLFENAATNSALFSTDPVAIDCVMHDLVRFERQQQGPPGAFPKPIQEACAAAGLGVNDDPNESAVTPSPIGPLFGYPIIDYQVTDITQLPAEPKYSVYLPFLRK